MKKLFALLCLVLLPLLALAQDEVSYLRERPVLWRALDRMAVKARTNLVPNVIFTVNGKSDLEDAAALAAAARAHKWGQINLLAVGIGGGGSNGVYAGESARAILNHYGAPFVPIGVYTDYDYGSTALITNGTYANGVFWANHIASTYSRTRGLRTNNGANIFEGFTRVIRRALVNAESNSVYYFVNDPPLATTNLLQSPADDLSPLTGLQLAARSILRAKVMMGDFPDPTQAEYNNYVNIPAATNMLGLFRRAGIGIDWVGYSLGMLERSALPTELTVFPSGWTTAEVNSPIYNLRYLTTIDGDTGRPAWGTLNLLTTIFETNTISTNLFTWTATGSNVMIAATGSNYWQTGPDVGERYLSAINTNEVQRLIRLYTERTDADGAAYVKPWRTIAVQLGAVARRNWAGTATGITYEPLADGSGTPNLIGMEGFIYTDAGSRDVVLGYTLPNTVTQAVSTLMMYAKTNDAYSYQTWTNFVVMGGAAGVTSGNTVTIPVTTVVSNFYTIRFTNVWTGAAADPTNSKVARVYLGASSVTSGSLGSKTIQAWTISARHSDEP